MGIEVIICGSCSMPTEVPIGAIVGNYRLRAWRLKFLGGKACEINSSALGRQSTYCGIDLCTRVCSTKLVRIDGKSGSSEAGPRNKQYGEISHSIRGAHVCAKRMI
jgi:hypothetical protein